MENKMSHEQYKEFLKKEESELKIGYTIHIIEPENLSRFILEYRNNIDFSNILSIEIVDCKIVKSWLEIKTRTIFI